MLYSKNEIRFYLFYYGLNDLIADVKSDSGLVTPLSVCFQVMSFVATLLYFLHAIFSTMRWNKSK